MKKKILIFTPYLIQGGVEHSLVTALTLLNYEKYDVSLYLYKKDLTLLSEVPSDVNVILGIDETHYYRRPIPIALSTLALFCGKLQFKGVEAHIRHFLQRYLHKKKVNYPKKKFFRNKEYDVVISYCLHICSEMALTIRAKHHYLFLHNSRAEYHLDIFEKCYRSYDALLPVNILIRDLYQSLFPDIRKIIVINNYVDARTIIDKSRVTLENFKKEEFTITTCGRISHEKGFDLAVEAAEFLKQNDVPFRWLFIGDGDDRTKIEDMITNKGLQDCIIITGFQDNPYPFMAQGDIYVQTSYEEAQPLVLLEAMVLGKPIVSTKTVGGQYILDNGNKGVLTGFSGKEIGEAVLNLIKRPALRKQYENLYTLEDNLREKEIYIQKWNQLLE